MEFIVFLYLCFIILTIALVCPRLCSGWRGKNEDISDGKYKYDKNRHRIVEVHLYHSSPLDRLSGYKNVYFIEVKRSFFGFGWWHRLSGDYPYEDYYHSQDEAEQELYRLFYFKPTSRIVS